MKNRKLLKFFAWVLLVFIIPIFGIIVNALWEQSILNGFLFGLLIDVVLAIGMFGIWLIDWLMEN